MTTERQTRMSFMRRPFKAGAAVRQRLPQYPAELVYLEAGRFGDLLLTLQMQSEGDTVEIRLSPNDTARVFKLLIGQMPDEALRAVLPSRASTEADPTFELMRQLLMLCMPNRWSFALVVASKPAADVETVRVTGGGAGVTGNTAETEAVIDLLESGLETMEARRENPDCAGCGYNLLDCRCEVDVSS